MQSALRRSLRASSIEGVFAEIVGACAGVAVLTGWALHLGMSKLAIALLVALPYLAQLLQLPAALLGVRLGLRRVCVAAITVERQVCLALLLVPSLSVAGGRLLLVGVALVRAAAGVVANNAWSAWMGELVPASLRGRYFAGRTARCTVAGSLAALIAGAVLDRTPRYVGLCALAAVASIAGLVTTFIMARQHEPARQTRAPSLASVWSALRDPRARPFLAYQVAWSAALGAASGLLTVHMVKGLGLGFAMVAVEGVAIAALRVLSAPYWGRAIDRRGAERVLVACSFGLACSPLLWTTPAAIWIVPFVLDPLVSGLLGSGQSLAAFALPLSIGSREQRPFQLAAFATAGGVSFVATAAIGGAVAEVTSIRIALVLAAIFRVCAAATLTLELGPMSRLWHVGRMHRLLPRRARSGRTSPP